MDQDHATSKVEARFQEWMAARGADPGRYWAGYNLISAGQLLEALYSDSLRGTGLTRDEWRILAMLELVRESEPRRLAESLWLGRSTVVNAVTRLEKRGLVLREPATNDRRLVIVRITDAGRRAADEGSRRQAETINSLSWEITPEEQATVARLSRRLWLANAQRVRKTLESSPRVGEATV